MFPDISGSIDKLTSTISNMSQIIKNIVNFFSKLSEVFKNLTYLLSNPDVLCSLLEPAIILLIMFLIILKLIGFKTGKWIRLFFIALFIVVLF